MKDFVNSGDHHRFSNFSLSIQSIIYDISEATGIKLFKKFVSKKFEGINATMNGLVNQHFEMTNVAMGTKGSSIQYTQQGQVEGLSIKIEQDELCIEDELADSIW